MDVSKDTKKWWTLLWGLALCFSIWLYFEYLRVSLSRETTKTRHTCLNVYKTHSIQLDVFLTFSVFDRNADIVIITVSFMFPSFPYSLWTAWLLCNYPNGDWHRCNISAVLDEPLLTGCDCQSKCHKRLHSSCASV